MTAPVPSRLPRSTTRREQPTDGGGDGGREVAYLASMDRYAAAKVWRSTLESVTFGEYEAFCDGWDAARAVAAPDSGQREDAVAALWRAHQFDFETRLCTCGVMEHPDWAGAHFAALLAEQPGGGR